MASLFDDEQKKVPSLFDNEPPKRTIGSNLHDAAIALTKGLVAVPQAAVGLGNIVSGGHVGKAIEDNLGSLDNLQKDLSNSYSPAQKEANQKFANSEGFVGGAKALIENPSNIVTTGIESLPSMFAGGLVGKGVQKLGALGSLSAGAVGEGVVGSGSAAENIRGETTDKLLSGGQTLAALGTGVVNTVAGQYGSKLASKLGAKDVDSILAGQADNAATKPMTGLQAVRGVVGGAASEGGEEAVQSGNEQILQNLALGKDAMDGVGKSVAMGIAAGSSMGGGTNALSAGSTMLNQNVDSLKNGSQTINDAVAADMAQKSDAAAIQPAQEAAAIQPAQIQPTQEAEVNLFGEPDNQLADGQANVVDQFGIQHVVDQANGAMSRALVANKELNDQYVSSDSLLSGLTSDAQAPTQDQQAIEPILNQVDATNSLPRSQDLASVVDNEQALSSLNDRASKLSSENSRIDFENKVAEITKYANDNAKAEFVASENARKEKEKFDRKTSREKVHFLANNNRVAEIPTYLGDLDSNGKIIALKYVAKAKNEDAINTIVSGMSDSEIADVKKIKFSSQSIEIQDLVNKALVARNPEKALPKEDKKPFLVNGAVVNYTDLSDIQKAGVDQARAEHELALSHISNNLGAEQASRAKKAAGMVLSAKLREATGNLTTKELASKAAFDAKIRAGDEVSTPDGVGVADGNPAYGKVKVTVAGKPKSYKYADVKKQPNILQSTVDATTQSPEAIQSIKDVKSRMRATLNKRVAGLGDAFTSMDKVRFITSEQAKSIAGTENAKAFFDEADGSVTFIADRIPSNYTDNQLFGVVLHEAGIHGGKGGKTDKEFSNLLSGLESLAKTDKAAQAAMARVPDNTPSDLKLEEAFGYFVEKNPEHSLVKKFVGYARQVLRKIVAKLGLNKDSSIVKWANTVSDTELLNAAMDGLKSYVEGKVASGGKGVKPSSSNELKFSSSEPTIDAKNAASKDAFKSTVAGIKSWISTNSSTLADETRIKFQDKFADLKPLVDSAGKVKDEHNPLYALTAMPGRRGEKHKDLERQSKDIIKALKASGISRDQFDQHMIALMVAKDGANKKLGKYGKDGIPSESPTGMTDAKAAELLANAPKGMDEVASMARKMVDDSLQLALDSSLINKTQYTAIKTRYPNYIPLPKQEDNKSGSGRGVSVSGKLAIEEGALSGDTKDVLAMIAQDRAKIIDMAEKNRVAMVLATFVGEYIKPIDGEEPMARLDRFNQLQMIDEETGYLQMTAGGLSTYKPPTVELNNGKTVNDPSYKGRENVIIYKIDGESHAIIFDENNPKMARLARNLKNMDDAEIGAILSAIGKITRLFSSINTQWNPAFGPFNFMRDILFTAVSASKSGISGAKVVSRAFSSWKDIYKNEWNDSLNGKPQLETESQKRYQKAKAAGIVVGYVDLITNKEARAEHIAKMTKDGISSKQGIKQVASFLAAWNTAFENSIRFAAYEEALAAGKSDQESVHIAKNITVNFNTKGTASAYTGSLYSFFNSAVQGTQRIGEILTERENGKVRLSSLGKKVLGGGIAIGVTQALMLSAAGFGPDEPDEATLSKNFVIPTGGKTYIKIPLPLGLHAIPSFGRSITQGIMHNDLGKRSGDILAMLADAFNPVGGGGASVLQVLAPTALDPIAALSENKDGFGRQIYREDRNKNEATPGYTRHKAGATEQSIAIAKLINDWTGGNSGKPGFLSPTPDQLDFLGAQAGGGIYRTGKSITKTVGGDANGDRSFKDVPVAGRLYGDENDPNKIYSRFSEYTKELNGMEKTLKFAKEDGLDKAKFRQENPLSALIVANNYAVDQIKDLTENRKKLKAKDAPQERIKLIDEKITAIQTKFNDKYAAIRDGKN